MDRYENSYSVLSQILDLLSNKRTFCSTVDELCAEIQVPASGIQGFQTVKSAVKFALDVGAQLGIIALEDSPSAQHPKKMPNTDKVKNKTRSADATAEARLVCGAAARKRPFKEPVPNARKLSVNLAREPQRRAPAHREPSDCSICLKRNRRLPRK